MFQATKHLVVEFETSLDIIDTYSLFAWNNNIIDQGTNDVVAHPFKDELYGCGYYFGWRLTFNDFKRAVWWKFDTNRNFVS